MKTKNSAKLYKKIGMKRQATLGGAVLICVVWQLMSLWAEAQETNTLEIIKQLQKRIEDLENNPLQKRIEALEEKIKRLENDKQAAQQAIDARLNERTQELEQRFNNLQRTRDSDSKQQIEALNKQVKVLQRNRELDQEAAETKAKEAARISVGKENFSLASADKSYNLQLKGVLQIDSRTFFEDSHIVGNDSILLRRARPVLQGTVARDFDFLFVPDFGGTSSPQIFDAYVNYRYNAALQLQAGKSKSPIGLEALVQDVDLPFNERALPTDLVPGRDLGIQLHGDLWDGSISYAAGVFNGVGDARNTSNFDFEDNKAFEGRIFFQPFKKTSIDALQGFGFGLGGSYERMQGTNVTGLPATTGGALAGYATDGQQQFFAYNPSSNAVVVADGEHWRLSPQGYYYYGPFGLLAEYVISDQRVSRTVTKPYASGRLDNRAWEITGSWIVTGEEAAYRGGVTPRHPFNPRQGEWGALQLVGRYAELSIDDAAFPLYSNPSTSARAARTWSGGLNWYLNKNVLVKANFSHTEFSGGGGAGTSAPAAVTQKDENVFFTRIQLSF
jgi:phosphate-selective porin OprO/OprP